MYDEYIDAYRTFEHPSDGTTEEVRPVIPDGSRYTSVGLFVQDAVEVIPGRVSLRAGLRYSRFSFGSPANEPLGVPDENVTTDAVTFSTGTVVSLSPALSLTVGVSRGFRAPNASDLGAIGLTGGGGFEVAPSRAMELGALVGTTDGIDAVTTGNLVRALKPESLYTFDVGLRFRSERLNGAVTLFELELVDQIQRRAAVFADSIVGSVIAGREVVGQDGAGRAYVAADARPIVTRVNIDRARIMGLETDVEVRLDADWSVRGFFSMTNGHELDTDALLRRPSQMGATGT